MRSRIPPIKSFCIRLNTTLNGISDTFNWNFRRSKWTFANCLRAAVCFGFVVGGPAFAGEDDPSFISMGTGYYDIFGSDEAAEFRLEYRNKNRFLLFKPFAGIAVTTEQAFFAYAGVLSDFYFGRRIVVTPSVAPGYYENGGGKDLGHEFEIKSGLEISYRLDDRSRIGVHFYHLSNAGLEDTKSGVEILGISYAVPLN